MLNRIKIFAILFFSLQQVFGQNLLSGKNIPGSFPINSSSQLASIYVDPNESWLIGRAAELLQQDIELVCGKKPTIIHEISPGKKNIIVIGTASSSSLLRQLAENKKINLGKISGKWEAFRIEVLHQPLPGIDNALVISGSDKRGAAYGVFEISRQIGVSPWYWWADVPVKKNKEIFIKPGVHEYGSPGVKYRGIFINDEAPALSNWSKEKFGGFNHQFYKKVFELMLRLRSNYIWPAMWGNAFYYDDSLNIKMADNYAIVIGTSHHEPLMRAHEEWKYFGKGRKWNYDSTEAGLKEYWKGGMERAWNEKIVSVGMRGDGDQPMSRETATALLEKIVKDQRKIIEEVTNKPADQTPQLWALYKEVQDYYDKGMRVPDDITLLLCDDNWGNIRRLPKLTDPPRRGGYGIYYHFDYVGGPRNYKWVNTNPIPRIWEQMHLAWEHNVKQIWIVNVGDIKPMELPISFFLDYAWAPDKIRADDIADYTEQWAADQFGNKYGKAIAEILSKYAKYNGRRKPELLDADTYSIENYAEAERVTKDYNDLLVKAEKINNDLPAEYKDAYFQLVLHPVKACANLQEMYTSVARNRYYAKQRLIIANEEAEKVKKLYLRDSLISLEYHSIAGGKWNHMMDQTHIGYTYWQQPPQQKMPELRYVSPDSALPLKITIDTMALFRNLSMYMTLGPGNIFGEKDGYVSISAPHFSKAVNGQGVQWKIIPDLGRTGSAISIFPVTAERQSPKVGSPELQYEFYTDDTGKIKLNAYFSPTLNIHNDEGLQYAISIDGETPQVISINKEDNQVRTWEKWVANNIIIKTTEHHLKGKGPHIIHYWMVDAPVVLQNIILDLGGLKPSYLGPPETMTEKTTLK